MVSFIVRMRFAAEDREQITEILRNLGTASRQEPGCVSYIPHISEADPDTVVIYEQYRDRAAADFHRTTPHFQKFAVGGLFQLMRERELENLNAVD
ncbi:MAG TPA: putative quinol monooxygenase [Acidobacteriaceae bacterium]|nr:putative quinol monooxygenase [Acidobacteriaceae bacterium]